MSKRNRIKGSKSLGIERRKARRFRQEYPEIPLGSGWRRRDGALVFRVSPVTRKLNAEYIAPKKVRQAGKEAA